MKRVMLKTSPLPVLVACLLAGVIFILDLYAPAGIVVCMLYVAPVTLIAMWSPPSHYSLVVVAAIICTTLIVVGFLHYSHEGMTEITISNQILALSTIWAMVFLSLIRKRMEQRSRWIDLVPRL